MTTLHAFWLLLLLTASSFFWLGLRQAAEISTTTTTTTSHVLLLPPETLDHRTSVLGDTDHNGSNKTITTSAHPVASSGHENHGIQPQVPHASSATTTTQDNSNAAKIPHILVFTHETNLLDRTKADREVAERFLKNIVHSIQVYANAWRMSENGSHHNQSASSSSPPIRVWFLDNDECETVLRHVYEPPEHADALVQYFRTEPAGPFRADLCRVAALYHSGGYYLDVDLKALEPVVLPSPTTFSTVIMLEGHTAYFQAFVAAARQQPVLMDSLRILLRYYAKKDNAMSLLKELKRNQTIRTAGTAVSHMMESGLIGPWSLKAAYEHRTRTFGDNDDESVVFLAEELLHTPQRRRKFPQLHYQDNSVGCCCHYVVHDGRRPYFFSRFVGSGVYCDYPDASKNDHNKTMTDHLGNQTTDTMSELPSSNHSRHSNDTQLHATTTIPRPSLDSLWDRLEQMSVALVQFRDVVAP